MANTTNIYDEVSEIKQSARSKKSRLIVFILSFIPIGLHNYYLGYQIRAITQTAITFFIMVFTPAGFVLLAFSLYLAWLTGEGLQYLLWYDVKDGDGFRLYDKENPPKPKRKNAILMAFLLPFGLHNIYLGNLIRGRIEWGLVIFVLATNISFHFIPSLFLTYYFIFLVVIICWIEGIWLCFKK